MEIILKFDTREEFEILKESLSELFGVYNSEPSPEEIRKQKKSILNKRNYSRRIAKESELMSENSENVLIQTDSDNFSTIQTDSDSIQTISDNVNSESKEEKREEKEVVSPLDSPLPFFPVPLYPIPPLIPPSEEKEERKEEIVAVSQSKTAKEQKRTGAPVQSPVLAESSKKSAQKVPVSGKVSQNKTGLTPDDDEWWNRFGKKKDLAIAFYRETKLFPTSNQWGHWQKDLDQFLEAGVSVDVMVRAIRKIQVEGKIEYKTPGSVLSTARWLMSQPKAKANLPKQTATANMTPDEVLNNGKMFNSAADMLRAYVDSQNRQINEVVDV